MLQFPSPRIRASLYLTALTLLLTILSFAACSSDEPTRSTPNPTQQSLLHELDTLSTETATLRQEVQTLKAQPHATTPGPTLAQPTPTAIETPTPSPTEHPTALIIPTPAGSGICGRSPAMQKAILGQLGSTSCRAITHDELFRITSFRNQSLTSGLQGPKPGDFAGLVNLGDIKIGGNFTLKAGTFAGSAIERLDLRVQGIIPGAFEDSHVGEMTLRVNKMPPQGSLPPTLTLLDLTIDAPSPIPPDLLANLTELQSLTLSITPHQTNDEYRDANPGRTPTPADNAVTLPAGLLDANTRLKHVFVTTDRGHSSARLPEMEHSQYEQPNDNDGYISMQAGLFAKLPHLEAFGIFNLRPRAHTSGTPPLTFHPKSPIHTLLTAPTLSRDEEDSLTSSERNYYRHQKTQQYKWEKWPYGYSLGIATHDSQLPN